MDPRYVPHPTGKSQALTFLGLIYVDILRLLFLAFLLVLV
jgi:hypothetical protein